MKKSENANGLHHKLVILICLVLTAASLTVYWKIQDHEFINYDDYEYVVDNPDVRVGLTGKGVRWAFTTFHSSNWHPLTWLSHMLDCQLYGLHPKGHHLNSLLFHIINTLLLFHLLRRMTGALWPSAFVAALFAIHPLHVESVAWISERKDVLSTTFWMLTLWAYIHYVEGPGIKRYLLTLLFFALGLMAKPMLVTLPFVLLLLDFWPLDRTLFLSPGGIKKRSAMHLIREKIPFFLLSVLSSVLTFIAQQKYEAIVSSIPLKSRIANAIFSYAAYISKMIWPLNLAFYYPHPGDTLPIWQVIGAFLLLLCISFLAVRTVARLPFLLVGWFWYLGTLVPVIGIIQVGSQGMADRYTYVPLIGLFIIVSWGAGHLISIRNSLRIVIPVFSVFILSLLLMGTWLQVRYWRNSIMLFEHAIKVTSNNVLAHNNLGNVLARQGKLEEASYHLTEALRIRPNDATIHNNLGNVLTKQGKMKKAILHYSEALRIIPDFPEARYNLDLALKKIKEQDGPSK